MYLYKYDKKNSSFFSLLLTLPSLLIIIVSVFLENAKLCSLTDNHETTVKLGEGEHSSKIALQSKYFERWSGKYKFFCTFLVRAPTGFGKFFRITFLSCTTRNKFIKVKNNKFKLLELMTLRFIWFSYLFIFSY